MSEHTPTPWAATTRQGSWDWVVYSLADPNIEICQPFHDGTEDNVTGGANAALIVRAVNSHAALRAALEEMAARSKEYIDCLSNYGNQDERTISALGHLCNAHNAARRALTEA